VSGWFRFGWVAPVVVLGIAAPAAGYIAMYFRLLRVRIGDGTLRYTNPFGVSRSWPADRATTAVITSRLLSPSSGGSLNSGRNLFVFDHAGKRLFRLSSGAWSLADLHAIAVALPKAHVEELDLALTEVELEKLHPHATPWGERHPYLLGLIVGVGVVAVSLGFVVLVVALS
jgi:hypothetical protein